MIQSWLSAWVVRDFHILYIAWLRNLQSETIIDLSDEYIFGYVQRVLTSAEFLFFSPENSTIASGEVNTILFITVRAFQ